MTMPLVLALRRDAKLPGLSSFAADLIEAQVAKLDTAEQQLLQIAGLVNGYHNHGEPLDAPETLRQIADVFGKPMENGS